MTSLTRAKVPEIAVHGESLTKMVGDLNDVHSRPIFSESIYSVSPE